MSCDFHRLVRRPRAGAVAACTLVCASAAAACVRQPRMAIEPAAARLPCRQLIAPSPLALTWVGPTPSRDRTRLDRWCTAVGPATANATPLVDPPAVDTLPIVVWNVHEGGGDLDALIDALTRGDFTGGTPAAAFVLLLQEIYRQGDDVPVSATAASAAPRPIVERPPKGTRRSALEVARARGLAFVYAPSMRNSGFGTDAAAEDRGNAIVSTQPIGDATAIELPFERQRRVAIAATIGGRTTAGAAWAIRVADVHLDTSLALTRGGPFAARRRQAIALIAALGRSPEPTIAGGDFNTWLGGHEPAVGVLRRAFPDTPETEMAATWHGPLGMRAVLDRVFASHLSGAVSVRRLPDRFGSDHYPVLARVDVRPIPWSASTARSADGVALRLASTRRVTDEVPEHDNAEGHSEDPRGDIAHLRLLAARSKARATSSTVHGASRHKPTRQNGRAGVSRRASSALCAVQSAGC
jgi:endonuclease/exonuclease/phosphatase family metal-dependent hydrolase